MKMAFALLLLVIIIGCSKKHKIECAVLYQTSVPAPRIFFRIVDKTTNEDLFFSGKPKYTLNQLLYFLKRKDGNGTSIYDTIPCGVDTAAKFFYTVPPLDTGFIRIVNLSLDTLKFTFGNSVPDGPCNFKRLADTVIFDRQIYISDTNRIFTFKK